MKAFFCTLVLTLCAVGLCFGLLWADVRTRNVTFENGAPPYIHRASTPIDLPLPATGEVLRRLFRSEKAILTYLLQKAENIT